MNRKLFSTVMRVSSEVYASPFDFTQLC